MEVDLYTLLLGAFIGLVSSIVAYTVNHVLNLRERRLVRKFEKAEKGRDFFQQTYGIVSTLGDYVVSFLQESDKPMVLMDKGYVACSKPEIIEAYGRAYIKYSKFWFESREKGFEIFITEQMEERFAPFWGYASYFNENSDWDSDKKLLLKFGQICQTLCDEMEQLLGLSEKKKWYQRLNTSMINRQV